MFLIMIGILIIIFVIYKIYYNGYNHAKFDNIIKILVRQCSRWAIAAEQDNTPLIKTLHANYAAGYLWAIKDIASDEEIYHITGINMKDFTKNIVSIQDKSTLNIAQICPQFAPVDKYLLNVANMI